MDVFFLCLCDRDCVTCNYHLRGFVFSSCCGHVGSTVRGAGEGIAGLLFFICPLKTGNTAGRGRVRRGTRVIISTVGIITRESWPLATYFHAIFTLYWLFVYFIVLQLELQFSRQCFASTGTSFTHSFFFLNYFISDFCDYPSQTILLAPTPTPQLPLHCNPVISGVATIKINARKKQCSIFSIFSPFL